MENLFGSLHDAPRHAGHAGYMDAEAVCAASGHELAEEDDPVA